MIKKRALLVIALSPKANVRAECEELSELAAVAGYFVAAIHTATVRYPKAATLIGAGAIEEAEKLAEKFNSDTLIVSADLSAMQARNLERQWQRRVIDRADLILEIFSARARFYESHLQVELARSRRHLSRLAGRWTHLERQRGGIGVRGGPGEKQIEIDRRLLKVKIKNIERKIQAMAARNMSALARREKNGALTAALVGYTNAGKSTIFNKLARANMPTNDRLFDTVESTARRVYVNGATAVLSDTVGFIRNLPHDLMAGFKATLQEAAAADLIIVVVDAAHNDYIQHLAVVHETLDAINAPPRRLVVMNKIDKIQESAHIMRDEYGIIQKIWLSGRNGDGIAQLQQALADAVVHKNAIHPTADNNIIADENKEFFSRTTS